MRKYYHEDIWKLGENQFFVSRKALEEYLKDNWEALATPIGDEKNFLRIVDNKFGGVDIVYEVMDYDLETGQPGPWTTESESFDIEVVGLTHLVSDI